MKKLSIIIPVKNEEEKLSKIIKEVNKLNPLEIIVIVNGSTDNTKQIASSSQCKIIEYDEPLGHDIGRAIGAFHAKGEVLLFLDGDMIIPYMELIPFIEAIENGYDMALNNLESILKNNQRPHSVSIVKKVINDALGYSELSINSLVATPHAISRNALQHIGWKNLAIPPLAQMIALKEKLSLTCPAFVDVINRNKIRYELHIDQSLESPYKPIEDIIFGDHLLAIKKLIDWNGKHGAQDSRTQEFSKHYIHLKKNKIIKQSAVLTDTSKGNVYQITRIIHALFAAGAEEIVYISTENNPRKLNKILSTGVKLISLIDGTAPFVSRAIGASISSGDKVLFMDSSDYCSPEEIHQLFRVIEDGADVALLDQSLQLDNLHPINKLDSLQYFLNIVMKKPELWNNSLSYSPHVIRKKCIEKIGFDSLLFPPLAYVKLLEHDSKFSLVFTKKRLSSPKEYINDELMVADHLLALEYFLSKTNDRGNFSNGDRNFSALDDLVNKEC
ncbi:glycosyltransferase [Neobacillus sp. D3-1R]|uniref:glycosyltransferase n=1 Tax=Neobacillus sp. D3-1R TaxID=3445778 RepID=UPI003F9FB8E3